MIICSQCKSIMAHVNDGVKYVTCAFCMFEESDFLSREEIVHPAKEVIVPE